MLAAYCTGVSDQQRVEQRPREHAGKGGKGWVDGGYTWGGGEEREKRREGVCEQCILHQ